ncbi:sulfotransferase family 2 domain-containing protein [Primorskyibacter flagellatus]|uniref:sulfotransferase family 2 domain-containing protein n=1 Tax=Primorskyibacter flagellatus TaxID=1387277 RepID=UPI003A8F1B86
MSQNRNLFLHPPLPMINGTKRYAIIWTPKVASNIVLTWYLRDIGLLYAANFYSEWSHRFRGDVLVKSQTYKAWLADAAANYLEYKYVKVMRDPFRRSVSSYRHALRFDDTRVQVEQKMGIDASEGFSYNTFLNFLSQLDIRNCDIHFRQQHHPVEDVVGRERIDYILLDAMEGELIEHLDQRLGDAGNADTSADEDAELKARVAHNLTHISALHHASYDGDAFDGENYADHKFACIDHKEFPGFEKFVTPQTEQLVRQIYAADFADMEHVLSKS